MDDDHGSDAEEGVAQDEVAQEGVAEGRSESISWDPSCTDALLNILYDGEHDHVMNNQDPRILKGNE